MTIKSILYDNMSCGILFNKFILINKITPLNWIRINIDNIYIIKKIIIILI